MQARPAQQKPLLQGCKPSCTAQLTTLAHEPPQSGGLPHRPVLDVQLVTQQTAVPCKKHLADVNTGLGWVALNAGWAAADGDPRAQRAAYLNQPSGNRSAAVASGRAQYSLNSCRPLTCSSPVSGPGPVAALLPASPCTGCT